MNNYGEKPQDWKRKKLMKNQNKYKLRKLRIIKEWTEVKHPRKKCKNLCWKCFGKYLKLSAWQRIVKWDYKAAEEF